MKLELAEDGLSRGFKYHTLVHGYKRRANYVPSYHRLSELSTQRIVNIAVPDPTNTDSPVSVSVDYFDSLSDCEFNKVLHYIQKYNPVSVLKDAVAYRLTNRIAGNGERAIDAVACLFNAEMMADGEDRPAPPSFVNPPITPSFWDQAPLFKVKNKYWAMGAAAYLLLNN